MSAPAAETEAFGHDQEATPPASPPSKDTFTGKSPMQIALARLRRDKIAMVCLGVIVFFLAVGIFATPLLKLFGVTTDTVLPSQYLDLSGIPKPEYGPPNGGFTLDHPFGIAPKTATDNLAYWVRGCQNSLQIAVLASVIATLLGVFIGLLAGYLGGLADRLLSFLIDFFLTVPFLLAALSLAPIVNERFRESDHYVVYQVGELILVLSLFGWMPLARLLRGEVLSLREREFVQAARVIGMPTRRILFRELLPNLTAPIVVSFSLTLPAFVAAEAGLAYLGIGVTSRPSWGQTISQATSFFETYPLYLFEPLLGIVGLVLSLNLLGDAIRDALDPKTRR